jgi:hypothetical protein
MTWADGDYRFCLPMAQLEELQTLCDAGPLVVAKRLEHGHWKTQDVFHTLRLGLIGGGMEAVPALKLCRAYVEGRWGENVLYAQSVLLQTIFGKPDEPVGKSRARGTRAARRARTESSTSASSTDSVS